MFTTGQFTRKVGLETNTIIRWLREGVVIPEPKEGRNNSFSFEEVLTIRAIAPLYTEWGLSADILAEIANFFREIFSIRAKSGYENQIDFVQDIFVSKRLKMYNQLLASSDGEEAAASFLESTRHEAEELDIKFPDDVGTGLAGPLPERADWHSINQYDALHDCYVGKGTWVLKVARNPEGSWRWVVGSPEQLDNWSSKETISFITVDLAKALVEPK